MFRKKPKFVLGFGGVSTFPILLMSVLLRIPTFIQEQNAVLGRVNRFFQRFSAKVFCHFSNTLFLDSKIGLDTGNPVRKKVLKKFNSQYLGPGPWPITILVLGGSQGARLLSDALPSCIETLSKKTKERLTIFHQARKDDIDKVFEFVNPNNNKEKLNLKCIEIGKKEFSLKSGLKLYTSIYEELSK